MRRTGAFTLMELLIVMGILSLLASMLMPMLGLAKRSANRTATQAVMHKVDTAVRLFRSEMGVYPYQLSYADPWSNRLFYSLGTTIDPTDLGNLQTDAATAEAKYAYYTAKDASSGDQVENLAGPPAVSVFAFRRADIHPIWSGSTNQRDSTDNPNDRLAMAVVLNRMAGELARLEVFAGNVDVTGLKIADAKTSTGAPYFSGRDNSGSKLLTSPQSAGKAGWADNYLRGELEKRYQQGEAIIDAYGKPLVFISQIHEGARFSRTYMFKSVVYQCDLRTYGLHRRCRTGLARIDPLTGATLSASAGLPDPAVPTHSDRRTYAATGYESDIEIWSAGPDRAFAWMRDDAANRDNIACAPYDKALQ